jgi:acyl-CoA thioester hydrolase
VDSEHPLKFQTHRVEARVTYGDTDAMGVVYHANYLRWFEIGRTEFMRHLGLAYKDLEDQGIYLPAVEVFCKYLISARYDDLLVIETTLDSLNRASIQFSYRILRKADGAEMVRGTTLHAFVNKEGKIVKVPGLLKEKLNS